MNNGTTIFDNTLSPEAKALLKTAIGRTLVSWDDDEEIQTSQPRRTSPWWVVRLDFGAFRLYATLAERDYEWPTYDVVMADVVSEEKWNEMVAAGRNQLGDPLNVPKQWNVHPVGEPVTGVTIHVDPESGETVHPDGRRARVRDACGIAFAFPRSSLLLEKEGNWSENWDVSWQNTPEPRLRGDRKPGVLVSERL